MKSEMLFGKVLGIVVDFITSESTQNGLNFTAHKLKENGHNVAGGVVGGMQKAAGLLRNVIKSDSFTLPMFSDNDKMSIDKARKSLSKGDHVAVNRLPHYSHHGIYVGDDSIIEYGSNKEIRYTTLKKFLGQSHYVYKIDSQAIYPQDEIVERAKSRLYEHSYSVFGNNCEQFARWCRNGD